MTMFNPDTPDLDKKLQEIECKEIESVMKEHGYSDEEIKSAIRNTHLHNAIDRLEDIMCENDEIFQILLEDGWKREEIEEAFKYRNSKRS